MKRGKIRNGQLRPLLARLTEQELDKRQYRINYRRRIAIALGIQAQLQKIMNRGFWGRFRFVRTGR